MIQYVCIALLLCTLTSGGWAVWQWYRARRLAALVRQLRETRRELKKQVAVLNKRVERRKARLQQFALMLSQMRDGVLLIDGDGMLIRVNDAARRLLNLTVPLTRKPVRYGDVLRHPPLREAIKSAMKDCHATRFELDIDLAGNAVHLKGSVARFDRDDLEGIMPLAAEMSDMDESEVFETGPSPRRASYDAAETRPDARVVDPPTESSQRGASSDTGGGAMRLLVLIRDQTERHEMESMRRDLTANLSHELKTPLAAIKGYAETIDLAIEDDVEAARHFMSQLHDQCRRMENMIADMLQLTRVQSHNDQLRIEHVDLDSIFNEAIEAAMILANQKDISIVRQSFDSPKIVSDREALLTIMNNLIGNAVRYTPRGGRVTVGATFNVAENRMAIHVEDNGVGIATEDQPKIFKRFYRVQRIGQVNRRADAGLQGSGPSDRSGTGLGLSIVKTLAKTLQGTVTIDSELGRGSRFDVGLPIVSQKTGGSPSSKLHDDTALSGVESISGSGTISP